MSSKVSGRPPSPAPRPAQGRAARPTSTRPQTPATEAGGPDHLATGDEGDRARPSGGSEPAPAPPGLHAQLRRAPPLSGPELALLAERFAAVLGRHPNADRRERARLLTGTILRSRAALARLLKGATEAQLDAMAAELGDLLGDSPLLAELIDQVSAGDDRKPAR